MKTQSAVWLWPLMHRGVTSRSGCWAQAVIGRTLATPLVSEHHLLGVVHTRQVTTGARQPWLASHRQHTTAPDGTSWHLGCRSGAAAGLPRRHPQHGGRVCPAACSRCRLQEHSLHSMLRLSIGPSSACICYWTDKCLACSQVGLLCFALCNAHTGGYPPAFLTIHTCTVQAACSRDHLPQPSSHPPTSCPLTIDTCRPTDPGHRTAAGKALLPTRQQMTAWLPQTPKPPNRPAAVDGHNPPSTLPAAYKYCIP